MTSDARTPSRSVHPRAPAILGLAAAAFALAVAPSALAAEPNYPFEGTWVNATRVCTAAAPIVRTYTAHEVTFRTGRCGFRKVAMGSGQFEIFEECHRAERPGNFTEIIRMLGPDVMQVRRQAARLKIARSQRFVRCSAAAPGASKPGPQQSRKVGAGAEEPRALEERAGHPGDLEP